MLRYICCRSLAVAARPLCQTAVTVLGQLAPKHLTLFHTARPGVPSPLVWGVIQEFLTLAAILTGIGLRWLWRRLPTSDQVRLRQRVNEHWYIIMLTHVLSTGLVYAYYSSYLVADPITKRIKCLVFTESEMIDLSVIAYEYILKKFKGLLVTSGNDYERVVGVMQRLVQGNSSLPGMREGRDWGVVLVNAPGKTNAFAMPHGAVFMFLEMLGVAGNDDQLAMMLAHEMAHVLLGHATEVCSGAHILELVMLPPTVLLWAALPFEYAATAHYCAGLIWSLVVKLPHSRQHESEADAVGLQMVARACYNPTQACTFFQNLGKIDQTLIPRWLSTHPSSKTRYQALYRQIPKVLQP